jgi:hypothetical protein
MPFTKLVKNSPYYSRYQTKYKRRQAGKVRNCLDLDIEYH